MSALESNLNLFLLVVKRDRATDAWNCLRCTTTKSVCFLKDLVVAFAVFAHLLVRRFTSRVPAQPLIVVGNDSTSDLVSGGIF